MMNESKPDQRSASGEDRRKERPGAQPWHAADEKRSGERRGGGAPIGTHSLTGGGEAVGMPASPKAGAEPERSAPRDRPPEKAEPDPLAEPRANTGDLLGRKP